MGTRFSQHHLLKRLSFLHTVFTPLLRFCWLYLHGLISGICFVLCISFYSVTILFWFTVALYYILKSDVMLFIFVFISKLLWIFGEFCVSTWILRFFSPSSVKIVIGVLMGSALYNFVLLWTLNMVFQLMNGPYIFLIE